MLGLVQVKFKKFLKMRRNATNAKLMNLTGTKDASSKDTDNTDDPVIDVESSCLLPGDCFLDIPLPIL
ncbi:hypothetical protein LIER_16009 [Lithospermum erythrorhizon]|uniref:Uncharacterized protein n=1 Tax=Lithospermum erythrorhizon TaxID=34254 RepID=A0AAV3Q9P5_LITER